MADRVGDWLRQAGRDVDRARLSASAGLHERACFAAHQAAEKTVKALHLPAARPEVDQDLRGAALVRELRRRP